MEVKPYQLLNLVLLLNVAASKTQAISIHLSIVLSILNMSIRF